MNEKDTRLSVVVPCYNEAKSIPLLLEKFAHVLTDKDELILVDNGSKDDTGDVLAKLLPEYPFVKVITVEDNIGYGYGIVSGLKAAKGVFLSWTHADMQTDPTDVITAYDIIKEKEDAHNYFIKGARRKRPLFDAFFTAGMGVFTSIMLGKWMTDINAQPNLFHSSFMQKLKKPPNDFSLDLYAYYMAKRNGLKIVKFPVDFSKRAHGSSHWNTGIASKWKFIKRTADFTFRLKKDLKAQGL